ncbi:MAG: efflux RND transporter periplasmic adaptor subunit [Saprospiraceae bacterium]|nr:efflux RND transporter periplasmic adaptor subunit [Saprospiraceae bacterium]
MFTNNRFNFLSLAMPSLFAALMLTACATDKTPGETVAENQSYPVTQPLIMDTTYQKEYVADIQSPQHVELRARIQGFLEKVHVDEGQPVREGQVLFTISSQALREELRKANALLNSANAEAKVAEVEVQNTRILVEKNVVSKSELAMSEAKLEALRAKIEEAKSDVSAAQLNISFAQVKAPFSGIINRIPNKQGSLIEEGMLLTTLSSNHDVFAYFNVSEKEYLELEQQKNTDWKKSATLQLVNGQLHPHKGKVETAETVIDKATGSIAFRARFLNPGHFLKHGSSGKVLIENELKNALVIPQKSTFEVQDKLYVYVLGEGNKVEMRAIVPKLRLSHLYVIESGLSVNDKFIYEGIQTVKQGDVVTPDFKPLGNLCQC